MKTPLRQASLAHLACSALLLVCVNGRGIILGPYTVDTNTLHLWHLDEPTVPALDSAPGGTNLTKLGGSASLGNASYPAFGTSLSTATTTGDYLAPRTLVSGTGDETVMTYADPNTGAFSLEAVLRVDFDPATFNRGNVPLYLVLGENETGDRPWQFRIHTNGIPGSGILRLQFFNLLGVGNTPFVADLPATGPDALAQGNWYHVAVTFDGAGGGGRLNFYWTLLDPTRTHANLIGSATMVNLVPPATGAIDFVLGNVSRNTPNGNFLGRIDEVRLSKIARSPLDMLFNSTNVVIVTPPASQAVEAGQPLTFTVVAAGTPPLAYRWRFNGTPLAAATASAYAVTSVQLTNAGAYDVVVSNTINAVTSSVAILTVISQDPVALGIRRAGTNFALFWSALAPPFRLQCANTLIPPIPWQVVTNPIALNGGENIVTVPNTGAHLAFRLASPTALNAVVPIDWTRFSAGAPSDTNAQRVARILQNSCHYALSTWWTNARNYAAQDASYYLDFGGIAESHIRAPAMEAFGLAVALQTSVYDPAIASISTAEARNRTLKLIRSLGRRHRVNQPGGWGNDWQSALWAGLGGTAGWLLWTNLAAADREYVRLMVEYEANRFNNYPVPYYMNRAGAIVYPGDTKSEENAWNASVLHVALCLMPAHTNAALWWSKAVELSLSTYARPSDINRTNVYHGRALAAWLNGSNLNEDGTCINHSRVHPDYMASGLSEFLPALPYLLAGRPVPLAGFFNLDVVYHAMVDRYFTQGTTPYPVGGAIQAPGGYFYVRDPSSQPTGDMYFPQGNDWGTLRRMHVATLDANTHAFGLDTLTSIPGDRWEFQHDQVVLDMQARFTDGRTYGASAEDTYSLREEWVCHFAAKCFLTKWLVFQGAFSVDNDP